MEHEQTYNTQYQNYKKPSWAPPQSLFGKVWSVLYIVIFIVNVWVLYAYSSNIIPLSAALPFWLNLIFNVIFTPIQFGLKNNYLASIDILLVLMTVIWSMVVIISYSPWVAIVFIPYAIWVAFASALQITITKLNG